MDNLGACHWVLEVPPHHHQDGGGKWEDSKRNQADSANSRADK